MILAAVIGLGVGEGELRQDGRRGTQGTSCWEKKR